MNAMDYQTPNQLNRPPAKPRYALRMGLMLAITALVFGGVFGFKALGAKMMGQYFDNMPVPPATISSVEVGTMSWQNEVEAPGSLVAVNGTELTTEIGGIVSAIHFESGTTVAAGAPLLTLDATNEEAELRRLEALARLADLNRERREKMFKLAAVSKSDLDASMAEAAAARAAVEAQAAKVADKQIRAPFAGELGIRRVNLGQYVAPGTPVVSLQSLDPIDVDFALPEQLLAQARAGLAVKVTVDAFPGQEFLGKVLAVEPRVDPGTRNFALRARLPNPERRLRAGMFARIELQLPGAADVVAVPRTAINYDAYGNSVFVIEKKKPAPDEKADAEARPAAPGAPPATDLVVRQRFVRTGLARGDFVAVLEGLKPGDQVATSGLLKLRNEQPVIINNEVQPDAQLAPTPKDS